MRKYPTQYSPEVKRVLSAMSIGTPIVVGSSADRRVLYSADYDMTQSVVLTPQSARAFVHHVAKLRSLPNTHILDIKLGEVSDWTLLSGTSIQHGEVAGYNRRNELIHLKTLLDDGIISEGEFKDAKKLLPTKMTPIKLLEARKALRFGVLRWTPTDVLRGYLRMRNGKRIELMDAFETSGITKVDCISYTGKYTEYSNIILWEGYSKVPDGVQSMKENIVGYLAEGNYLKALKRMFSLAKAFEDTKTEEKCVDILNSEVGYLYSIVADLETLETLRSATLTTAEKRKMRRELGYLTDRIAKVWLPGNKRPKRASFAMLPKLYSILQNTTRLAMEESSLLPPMSNYLP